MHSTSRPAFLHPMPVIAGIAVMLFCGTSIAGIMGCLPGSGAGAPGPLLASSMGHSTVAGISAGSAGTAAACADCAPMVTTRAVSAQLKSACLPLVKVRHDGSLSVTSAMHCRV
ncbi:MAG: hypothetical protein V4582_23230 [Pseudomonadota bacterium]